MASLTPQQMNGANPSQSLNYYHEYFPTELQIRLESGVFESICGHLQDRSDTVPNIDMMSIAGFCRNCLAKWLVVAARMVSKSTLNNESLDSFTYDDAAKLVYKCDYGSWKKRYGSEATADQKMNYELSKPIHAVHNNELLKNESAAENVKSFQMSPSFQNEILPILQSDAFKLLCQHLRDRSDEVQNIDMMTTIGFCRNCIAKWIVFEARKLSSNENYSRFTKELDVFGYDDAAQVVYGCAYDKWKQQHMKKASEEKMAKYDASKHLHAIHDSDLLKKRRETPLNNKLPVSNNQSEISSMPRKNTTLLSNVCCQDVDANMREEKEISPPITSFYVAESHSYKSAYIPPPPPNESMMINIGILTVSDRAANNQYESGDLSGPAVETAITEYLTKINTSFTSSPTSSSQNITGNITRKEIIPDEKDKIQDYLLTWSGKKCNSINDGSDIVCDIIFTTGGTGLNFRDVTPEATSLVLDYECKGLMVWVYSECAAIQPFAPLSRGIAGVCGKTLIVNLPGNPGGVNSVINILFPLLLHAIVDLKRD